MQQGQMQVLSREIEMFFRVTTATTTSTTVNSCMATDQASKDIIRKLLKINKSKRLGKAAGGAASVMKHKWYSGFDWEGLLKKQLEVPIKPQVCLLLSPAHTTESKKILGQDFRRCLSLTPCTNAPAQTVRQEHRWGAVLLPAERPTRW